MPELHAELYRTFFCKCRHSCNFQALKPVEKFYMRNGTHIFTVYSCFINLSVFNRLTTAVCEHLVYFKAYLWEFSSSQCTVPSYSVLSNKAVQIDLLHQETESQDKDETCFQKLISVRSESHLSIFSSLVFCVMRPKVGGSEACSNTWCPWALH